MCHWLTVMAPAQVIEPKDLPPEVRVDTSDVVPTNKPQVPVDKAKHAIDSGACELPETDLDCLPSTLTAGVIASLEGAPVTPWELGLDVEARALLAGQGGDVWDALTRRFESRLILAALAATRGRRVEAAQKLGIGRNTITRKIPERGLE